MPRPRRQDHCLERRVRPGVATAATMLLSVCLRCDQVETVNAIRPQRRPTTPPQQHLPPTLYDALLSGKTHNQRSTGAAEMRAQ